MEEGSARAESNTLNKSRCLGCQLGHQRESLDLQALSTLATPAIANVTNVLAENLLLLGVPWHLLYIFRTTLSPIQTFDSAAIHFIPRAARCGTPISAPDPEEMLNKLRQLHRSKGSHIRLPAAGAASKRNLRFQIPPDACVMTPLTQPLLGLLCLEESPRFVNEELSQLLNRLLTSASFLWQLGGLAVLALPSSIVAKIGPDVDVDHVASLSYLRSYLKDIPAPRVYGVVVSERIKCIFMEAIIGQPLDKIWGELDHAQKSSIQLELNRLFPQIRTLPRRADNEGCLFLGCEGSKQCKDLRRNLRVSSTAISDESGFNDFLTTSDDTSEEDMRQRMLRSFLRTDHQIVFTHADLHPRNIMVSISGGPDPKGGTVKVTGILDWEMSGWYPGYWEYVKALQTVGMNDSTSDWWAYLPTDAIGSWPGEYAIDIMISRWLG